MHPAADGPYLDSRHIADELRGLAAVVVVEADATYGLTDTLDDKQLSVFYGAGRVYPTGWRGPTTCISPRCTCARARGGPQR